MKRLREFGVEFEEMEFYVRLGREIIDHEMALRRRLVRGKSKEENMRITLEVAKRVDLMHGYIMRRLFQRNIMSTIQKSLAGKDPGETE